MTESNLTKAQRWSKYYNGSLLILYSLIMVCFVIGSIIMQFQPRTYNASEYSPTEMLFGFVCISIFIIPLIVLLAFNLLNLNKPSKTVYVTNFIALVIGFDSIVTVIPAVIILIKWIDQEVKDYYMPKKTE